MSRELRKGTYGNWRWKESYSSVGRDMQVDGDKASYWYCSECWASGSDRSFVKMELSVDTGLLGRKTKGVCDLGG